MLSFQDIQELDTPCYVFDEKALEENFRGFTQALQTRWSADSRVAYSVKTNPLPWVVSVARRCGCWAEVVSDDEYELALECGFEPEEIVFNGPVKGRDFFEQAVLAGSCVNIDSRREIRWAKALAAAHPDVAVGVRANIALEKYCPGECLSDEHHGRFGFSYEGGALGQAIDELREAGVTVDGLHMHVTTRSRSQHVYDVLSSYAARIIGECGLDLSYVDMGGGYYGGGPQNAGAYDRYAETIAANLSAVCDPSRTRLIVEPGGAVVCTPGYYVGRILDAKDILDERYVVSELSRINIDHEMKKTSYNLAFHCASDETLPRQTLCGYTCMDSDRLCTLEDAPALAEGDAVVINFAGAYSNAFTPGMFIEHPPAVYRKAADGMHCIRPLHRPQFPKHFRSTAKTAPAATGPEEESPAAEARVCAPRTTEQAVAAESIEDRAGEGPKAAEGASR